MTSSEYLRKHTDALKLTKKLAKLDAKIEKILTERDMIRDRRDNLMIELSDSAFTVKEKK